MEKTRFLTMLFAVLFLGMPFTACESDDDDDKKDNNKKENVTDTETGNETTYKITLNTENLKNATATLSKTQGVRPGEKVRLTLNPKNGNKLYPDPWVSMSSGTTGEVSWDTPEGGYYLELSGFTGNTVVTVSDHNGYECVDLGLSVRWAVCNVGAEKPEQIGNYYAWGETFPKTNYTWSSYLYGDSNYMNKYIVYGNNPVVDRKGVLEPLDDAAVEVMGKTWRMPTEQELNELISKCEWVWTTKNNVSGYEVKSRKYPHSIFLPVGGYADGTEKYLQNSASFYWSSTLSTIDFKHGRALGFDNGRYFMGGDNRYRGFLIRPVLAE